MTCYDLIVEFTADPELTADERARLEKAAHAFIIDWPVAIRGIAVIGEND